MRTLCRPSWEGHGTDEAAQEAKSLAFWEMQRPGCLKFGEQMGEWLEVKSEKWAMGLCRTLQAFAGSFA